MDVNYVIAMTASTGGKDSIYKILKNMPPDIPPILIVQHMPPKYVSQYVRFMNNHTNLHVIESKDGDELKNGLVIVATDDHQMRLINKGSKYYVSCKEDVHYRGNCPSADILFMSAAEIMADKAIGVILTGLVDDGSEGLAAIKKRGGLTLGQDQSSSVAYDMPKRAFKRGVVMKQANLSDISSEIQKHIAKKEAENRNEAKNKSYTLNKNNVMNKNDAMNINKAVYKKPSSHADRKVISDISETSRSRTHANII